MDIRLLMVLGLAITGCTSGSADDQISKLAWKMNPTLLVPLEESPCGSLRIVEPFINVSGSIQPAREPALWLHIAPNVTQTAASYVVRHCAPLGRVAVNTSGSFTVALPRGQYVVVARLPNQSSGKGIRIEEQRDGELIILPMIAFEEQGSAYAVFTVEDLAPRRLAN